MSPAVDAVAASSASYTAPPLIPSSTSRGSRALYPLGIECNIWIQDKTRDAPRPGEQPRPYIFSPIGVSWQPDGHGSGRTKVDSKCLLLARRCIHVIRYRADPRQLS